LPSKKSVSSILKEYLKIKQNEDGIKNEYSSRLNETINGLIRYFNSMLGSQLLYKFERVQYTDVSEFSYFSIFLYLRS
jgi:mortality factor 4-like protein 1